MAKGAYSIHNKKVREVAKRYRSEGWQVAAAIPGFKQPKKIYQRIPDIDATKGRKRRIREIETPKSAKRDRKQQDTLRRCAQKSKNTTFRVIIAKKKRRSQ